MQKKFIAYKESEMQNVKNLKRPFVMMNIVTGTVRKIGEYEDVLNEYNKSKQSYENLGMSELFKDEILIDVLDYINKEMNTKMS